MPDSNELDRGKRVEVQLQATSAPPTPDQALWAAIRNRTDAIGFNRYQNFIDDVLCADPTSAESREMGTSSVREIKQNLSRRPTLYGIDSYQLLRFATEMFLILECGVKVDSPAGEEAAVIPGEDSRLGESVTFQDLQERLGNYLRDGKMLPYLDRVLTAIVGVNGENSRRMEVLAYCDGVLRNRLTCPSLLELIWSYWHEEGMLVQTMNAITLRFQNRRKGPQDPLANLEIDPLRPLNNLLWGFIQDEPNRLTVQRRAYEYDHHYGISLYGKAVPNFQPADSRSKFIRAFHHLLHRAAIFYQDEADTTILPDSFPLLNALKDVHLILAEGAHNQFGDLPWTARVEMLVMEWLLARPEMREFLRGRHMVPYREPWMGAVDAMKKLQGWTDVAISHFRDLGVFGEQIILSIRYGDWVDVNDQDAARNWARYWRPEIQSYIHSYLASTGVDLATEVMDAHLSEERFLQPSAHLRNRLAEQRGRGVLPPGGSVIEVTASDSLASRSLPPLPARLSGGRGRNS
jgi:hypothetical protein